MQIEVLRLRAGERNSLASNLSLAVNLPKFLRPIRFLGSPLDFVVMFPPAGGSILVAFARARQPNTILFSHNYSTFVIAIHGASPCVRIVLNSVAGFLYRRPRRHAITSALILRGGRSRLTYSVSNGDS